MIDGKIDAVWSEADTITDFVQRTPDTGEPETNPTEVKVLYSKEGLYLLFVSHDGQDGKPPSLGEIEQVNSSDQISILIDPCNDGATGYYFAVLRGNSHIDAYFENGGIFNKNWNGVWYSEVSEIDEGWTAEIYIPFKNLPLQGKTDTFRINFLRFHFNSQENTTWYPLYSFESSTNMDKSGTLLFPEKLSPLFDINLDPFVLAKSDLAGESSYDAGLSLDLSKGKALDVGLTINPDYAQIEADTLQFNFSRFELYLPEKRNFFTSVTQYLPPTHVFYTRRVVKPLVGGKALYRKNDDHAFLMYLKDNEGNHGDYLIGSLKKSFLKMSDIGLFINAFNTDAASGMTGFVGMNLRFSRYSGATSSLTFSSTGTPGYGAFQNYYYNSKYFSFNAHVIYNDDNLDSPEGYFFEAGQTLISSSLNIMRYKSSFFHTLYAGLNSSLGDYHDSEDHYIFSSAYLTLVFYDFSTLSVNGSLGRERYGASMSVNNLSAAFASPSSLPLRFSAVFSMGKRADYYNLSSISYKTLTFDLAFSPTGTLKFAYGISYDTTLPLSYSGGSENHLFYGLWYLTSKMFVRAKLQMNTLYNREIYEILYSWEILPRAFLYLAARRDLQEGNSLIFKIVI